MGFCGGFFGGQLRGVVGWESGDGVEGVRMFRILKNRGSICSGFSRKGVSMLRCIQLNWPHFPDFAWVGCAAIGLELALVVGSGWQWRWFLIRVGFCGGFFGGQDGSDYPFLEFYSWKSDIKARYISGTYGNLVWSFGYIGSLAQPSFILIRSILLTKYVHKYAVPEKSFLQYHFF